MPVPGQTSTTTARALTWAAVVILLLAGFGGADARAQPAGATTIDGVSASGSRWRIDIPADWNGRLLLYSHGWSPVVRDPAVAPPGLREALLARGYALAASSYATGGWAVAEAVPDQLDLLAVFRERYGRPERVIAWGNSMGGLVTTTLAERHADAIDAALPMCASSGGALGMMNTGLDGAFAFATLLGAGAGIRVVEIEDDRANAARVTAVLEAALADPGGRARVALASVLGGLPGWTQPDSARPRADDFETQAAEMAASFVMGVFLPRAEQEQRAGGVFSWNTGIDYRAQLERSGRRPLVEHMYALAGLDLEADLDRLDAAPRIAADPEAAAYMMRNATPSGEIGVPVLSLHTIGDGLTSPSLQAGYLATVQRAGRGALATAVWNERAGHCSSSAGEMLAALGALEARLDTGRWAVSSEMLNAAAVAASSATQQPATPTFVAHSPPPLMRPCADGPGACPGLPGR